MWHGPTPLRMIIIAGVFVLAGIGCFTHELDVKGAIALAVMTSAGVMFRGEREGKRESEGNGDSEEKRGPPP